MIRPFVLAVVAMVIFLPQLRAQTFNVVNVNVVGNKVASTSLILSVAGIKKGDELTASVTQEAVSRLYGLGFFRDIEILAEEVTGGLNLTIKVTELPKLGVLKFTGNKEIKTNDIKEKLNLTGGSYLSQNLIYEKRNKITDIYGEKGYYLVQVDFGLQYSQDSSIADLTYNISEGSKVKVEKVVLTGNERVPAKDIIGKMRNRKRGLLKSSNFDKEKYPEDMEKIITYLHNKGFIDAYLKSDSIAIDSARNRMTIYLDIYEGPRYYFGTTQFTGNEVLPDEILASVLKYKENAVFDNEKFDESIYEIYFLYQEKGHLHVRVIDDRKTSDSLINITFDIVEGLPSEINLVRILGNTRTKEKVIRREMSIRPGQVFHRSLLIRSVRDIMQLNYFGNVTPDITNLPSGDVDVVVTVEEKPTAQVSAGAGYSGVDKFVGTFGLGIPNFRGMGQNLSLNMDIGSTTNSYSLSFTEPWAFSTPTSVGVDLYSTNREWYSDYTEGRRGGAIRIGRRLRWPDNYFRAYARYRIEGDRFYDFSDSYTASHSELTIDAYEEYVPVYDTSGTIIIDYTLDTTYNYEYGSPLVGSLERFNKNWLTLSSVELSVIRDSRDLPQFATRGSIISYSLEQSGGILGGFWEYQKHVLTVSKFIPLLWKFVLASQVTAGLVSSPGADTTILESERFSPGGTGYSGIIRGYDDGSLTPDSTITRYVTTNYYDATSGSDSILVETVIDTTTYTTRVRGKYMLVGNFELQLPIIENQLYGLAFFDIGNSWLHQSDINLSNLYRGVGLGFRLVVPGIGTIGFDFGYALDEHGDDGKGWKPHFQVGTTFR